MIYHKHIVGLDIGSHSVQVVRASRRPGNVIVWRDLLWLRLPSSPVEQRKVLRSFIEKNGLVHTPCVVALRGRAVMLQTLTIDPKDPRAVSEIVSVEMGQVEGLASEQTVSEFETFRGLDGERLVLVAVARAEAVKDAMALAAELELDVTDVVPAAVAVAGAVQHAIGRGAGCTACVEVGHAGTEIVVVAKGRVLFARYLSRGASAFPAPAKAETPADPGAAAPGAETVVAWAGEVASCLEVYGAHFKGTSYRLDRVVLTGSGALQPGLPARVAEATGIKTFLLRDLMRRRAGEEVERYGAAMGLALAGLRRGGGGLSLFPRAIREKVVLQWQKKYWMLCAAALAGLMLALIWGVRRELGQEQAVLRQKQAELAGMRGQERELARYRALNADTAARLAPFRSGLHNGESVRAVLDAVTAAKHPDDWIVLLADERSYFGPPVKPAVDPRTEGTTEPTPEKPQAFERIIVEGYTRVDDFSTVRRMIETLRTSSPIMEVDLLADERVRKDEARDALWQGLSCRLFALEIKVRMP